MGCFRSLTGRRYEGEQTIAERRGAFLSRLVGKRTRILPLNSESASAKLRVNEPVKLRVFAVVRERNLQCLLHQRWSRVRFDTQRDYLPCSILKEPKHS